MCDGGDTMDDEQQQPQSEERRGESTLLKLHEEQQFRLCRKFCSGGREGAGPPVCGGD